MISMSPNHEIPRDQIERSIDTTKKKEANFKHLLNLHHISDIVSGKRNRKPPESLNQSKQFFEVV